MTCAVDGCPKPARPCGWCGMHYMRHHRHGDVSIVRTPVGRTRYRTVTLAQGHPLANASGAVYEHRLVLFEHIGYGPHRCYWCGLPINWRRGLVVDHLDGVKVNNDPSNLVASCQPCNGTRHADGWLENLERRRALVDKWFSPARLARGV